MKKNINKYTQKGFTLLELMVVIAILGVLAAAAAPSFIGYMESAEAGAAYSGINNNDDEIKQLATLHRFNNCASGTTFTNANNNFIDVIYNGSAMVITAQQAAYNSKPHTNITKSFDQITAAVAGTSAGVYQIEGMVLSILTCTAGENGYRLAGMQTSVLQALLEAEYPTESAAFASATPVTTGQIRYSAVDSSGLHNVDFYIKR
jgi:prepilin-type N-terminal cleavage/methylation domain-containing protein